jgi:hypothetical protein
MNTTFFKGFRRPFRERLRRVEMGGSGLGGELGNSFAALHEMIEGVETI